VCDRSMAGIAGSNSAEGTDIRLLCLLCCVGSGHCDELIACSEESYWCVCVCVCVCVGLNVCDLQTSTMRRPRPDLGYKTTEEEEEKILCFHFCLFLALLFIRCISVTVRSSRSVSTSRPSCVQQLLLTQSRPKRKGNRVEK
jgi:hypothetical protein